MKMLIRSSYLILLVLTIFMNFQYSSELFFPDGKNRAHLERLTCRTFPGSKVVDVRCLLRYIDRNHLRAVMYANLSEPVGGLWVHAVIYYRYNTYQKIATEYWDDLCEWMNGTSYSYVMTYLKPIILKYSNFNHTCPYAGIVHAKVDNVSVQALTIPQIMPAGRYRVDFNYTEGDRKTVLVAASLYGSISDHRVEIV